MKRIQLILAALLALAVTSFALAQNADKNSAGPTKNDYRLRNVEPVEGATITGTTLRVVVDTEIPAERDTAQTTSSMPRPTVDVFVDDLYRGTIRYENNVLPVENVEPGPHTIVLLAKNMSGEIIDRKQVHVMAVAPPVVKPAVERPAPAPAPPAPVYQPPAATPEPAPAPPEPVRELPKTGSHDPLLAAAGLALLFGGLALRRFA